MCLPAQLRNRPKDYQFEVINLNQCLGKVLEDLPRLEEKHL